MHKLLSCVKRILPVEPSLKFWSSIWGSVFIWNQPNSGYFASRWRWPTLTWTLTCLQFCLSFIVAPCLFSDSFHFKYFRYFVYTLKIKTLQVPWVCFETDFILLLLAHLYSLNFDLAFQLLLDRCECASTQEAYGYYFNPLQITHPLGYSQSDIEDYKLALVIVS